MKRYMHWVVLAVILVILGVTWYRVESQPADPLNLFPSEQADRAQALRTYGLITIVATILAIVEERRKRRNARDAQDPHGHDNN